MSRKRRRFSRSRSRSRRRNTECYATRRVPAILDFFSVSGRETISSRRLPLPPSFTLSLSLTLSHSLSLSLSLSLYKFFLFIFICKTIMRIEPVARSTRFDSTRLDSVANLEHTLEMRAILPTNSTLPIALDRTDGCVATSSDDFALCTRRRETRDRLGRPSFSLASRSCCSSAPSPRTPLFLVLAESANAAKILSVARSIRRVPL